MTYPIVTAQQMAEVDRRAVEEYGIEIIQLMENAARSVADFVRMKFGDVKDKRIVCLAGNGNNGGDAIAAARHLVNAGGDVIVVLAGRASETNSLSQKQIAIVKRMGVQVIEYFDVFGAHRDLAAQYEWRGELDGDEMRDVDLIIDGLLGYNIKGDPRGVFAELIAMANNSRASVLSYDMPSGIDPDKGEPNNPTICADWTVTLALPKAGLLKEEARECVGELWLADISIPNKLYQDIGIDAGVIFSKASLVLLE